ncbi:hypothetical protein OPT61_g9430 [Boeremia exigua]|uniref:Uncharacterized protein n=1 Tax=Boeremia exigua TaxID=749465 RepID=A0ACC2HU30_9PLEO|nr:hypothetical protein OPT61_g9430 [Boeremia exigua]
MIDLAPGSTAWIARIFRKVECEARSKRASFGGAAWLERSAAAWLVSVSESETLQHVLMGPVNGFRPIQASLFPHRDPCPPGISEQRACAWQKPSSVIAMNAFTSLSAPLSRVEKFLGNPCITDFSGERDLASRNAGMVLAGLNGRLLDRMSVWTTPQVDESGDGMPHGASRLRPETAFTRYIEARVLRKSSKAYRDLDSRAAALPHKPLCFVLIMLAHTSAMGSAGFSIADHESQSKICQP